MSTALTSALSGVLLAAAPMGDLGASVGVGGTRGPVAVLGPELSLAYQHPLLPAVYLRMDWRLLWASEARMAGMRGGFAFALPADLLLGANLSMDSGGGAPELAGGGGLSWTHPMGPVVLELGVSASTGLWSWRDGEGSGGRYQRAGLSVGGWRHWG